MVINYKIFWTNVRKLRQYKGMTLEQLAFKIRDNNKALSNRERRFPKVPMDLAQKIAEALETTVEALATGEEPEEYNNEAKTFFNNLRIKRQLLEISQTDMAKMLGISRTNLAMKESLKVEKITDKLAHKVATVLQCTVRSLFTPPRKEYHISHVTTDDKEYNALSKRTKEAVNLYPDHLRPKVSKAKAHNDVREMAIEFLEMSVGNYADNKITHTDYTRWIPGLIKKGIVEESSKGIYRLTEKFAEPM